MRSSLILLTLLLGVSASLLAGPPEPGVSKRQRKAIDELIDVMHLDQLMIDTAVEQLTKPLIDASDEDAKWAADRYRELMRQQIDSKAMARNLLLKVFPRYFNDDELDQLVAFYRSPAGQKTLIATAALTKESQLGDELVGKQLDAISEQVEDERRKRKPWWRTMNDITKIANGLEAYGLDHGGAYPKASDVAALASALGQYVKDMPARDGWGNAFAYVVSADGKHYRIASAGSDGNFERNTRTIAAVDSGHPRLTERAEDDVIYADGVWVQLPKEAIGK